MLTYRGDRFVKDKKFKINESVYKFQKRDNKDRLVFEGLDKQVLKLTEAEFNRLSDNAEDKEAVSIVKSYLEEGNQNYKDTANYIINMYSDNDSFPELNKYLKESAEKTESIEKAINEVADDFSVSFSNKVPFEYFYAPDSDDEDGSWYSEEYDWAAFYNEILNKLGYNNPVLGDFKAEVSEVSDGKYTMTLFVNGEENYIDLRAWDELEDVKDNVEYIISLLN